jgi:hypothetical protein
VAAHEETRKEKKKMIVAGRFLPQGPVSGVEALEYPVYQSRASTDRLQ